MTSLAVFEQSLHDISLEARGYIGIVNHLNCEYEPVGERDNGDPNPYHFRDVMRQIIEIFRRCNNPVDWATVYAGGCHDLIENTYGKEKKVTPEIIEKAFGLIDPDFGRQVATLVSNVSKLPREEFLNKAYRLAEYHERLFTTARKDFRVLLIKYPDRGHNVATLHGLVKTDPQKVERISKETLDFYVPMGRTAALRILPECLHGAFGEWVDRMEFISLAYVNKEYRLDYIQKNFKSGSLTRLF